jgi:hypothetical protein
MLAPTVGCRRVAGSVGKTAGGGEVRVGPQPERERPPPWTLAEEEYSLSILMRRSPRAASEGSSVLSANAKPGRPLPLTESRSGSGPRSSG